MFPSPGPATHQDPVPRRSRCAARCGRLGRGDQGAGPPRAGGHPDVRQGDADGHHRDGRDHRTAVTGPHQSGPCPSCAGRRCPAWLGAAPRTTRGATTTSDRRQRVAHEPRSLARAARVAEPAAAAGGAGASPAAAGRPPRPRRRHGDADRPPVRRRIDTPQPRPTSTTSPMPNRAATSRVVSRRPTASSRIASAGSRVVTMSGRPSPARSTAPRSPSRPGTPQRDRVVDAAQLLDPQPHRRRPAACRRAARSGTSAAVPSDSRVITTRPSSSASTSTRDPVEPVDDLERHRLAPVLHGVHDRPARSLEAGPPEHQRPVVLVLELVLGVDPAGDGHVAGGAGLRQGDGPRHRDDLGRGQDPADAGAAPERAEQDPADREQREAGHGQEDGDHRGMIAVAPRRPAVRAGGRSGGIKSPKEPTRRVGVEVIAAVSIARPLRAATHATGRRPRRSTGLSTPRPPDRPRLSTPPVHRQPAARPVRSDRARAPGRRSSSAPAGRPPARPSVTTSECATRQATSPSGSIANVSISAWTMTWPSRDDPRTARIGVADRWLQRSSPVRASNP